MVEEGHDFALEDVVKRLAVDVVALGVGIVVGACAEGPADGGGIAFDPPAVKDAQVGHAVGDGLHAAGAGGFEGADGSIDPDVDALNEVSRDVNVVVFDEGDAVTHFRLAGEVDDLFDELLAGGQLDLDLIDRLVDEDPRRAEVFRERPQAVIAPVGAPFPLGKRSEPDGKVFFDLGGYRVEVNPEDARINIMSLQTKELLTINLTTARVSGDALDSGAFVQGNPGHLTSSDGGSGLVMSDDRVVFKTPQGAVDIRIQEASP